MNLRGPEPVNHNPIDADWKFLLSPI